MLEGSVRKTGAWLHINAQLIDARTDSHVWAEEYDRDLKDMFARPERDRAKGRRSASRQNLAAERLAIERPPTADLTAFDLYSRAKNLVLTWNLSTTERRNLLQAADLLNQAVAHDPTFFQAYCQLAWVHDELYHFRFDRTPARLALAEAAIEAAFRLRPDAGEAHLARAGHLYRGYLDYDGALAELEIARQTLPNDARLFAAEGLRSSVAARVVIKKRRYAISSAQSISTRAMFSLLQQTAFSYDYLRRYRGGRSLHRSHVGHRAE